MNLTIENFLFRKKFGDQKAFEMIKNAGFDGVDFSFNELLDDGSFGCIDLSDYKAKAKQQKDFLDAFGLSCSQAHAPFDHKYYSSCIDKNGTLYKNIISAIKASSIIGIKTLVVHALRVDVGQDFLSCNLEFYKSLEDCAKDYGVKIAVENLVSSIFWQPNQLSQFIRQLDSPVFCACIDVGHAYLTGVQPEKFIAGMDKGVIECVHLHDTDGKFDRHWIPFYGEQNWDKTIKALADYGFNGDMNLEVIHTFDNLPLELYAPTLEYVAKVGKYLKEQFIKYKNQK